MEKTQLTTDDVLQQFEAEYKRASFKFADFHSYHEGYAVIKEELDELWDEIKGAERQDRIYQEAIQVGAMALRFIMDL